MANRTTPSPGKDRNMASPRRPRKERKTGHSPLLRILGTLGMVVAAALVTGMGAGVGYAASLLEGLPSISAATFTNLSQPSVVYDRNGQVIGRFSADGDRSPIQSLADVSPNLVHAFIAAEDKTFYQNIGINPLAMIRAFVQDVTTHHIESGASTITQQTVKLALFPDQQRTMKRKVQEIALAVEVNHLLTKNEVMTDYMNWVYMGQMGGVPVYGVKTASELLFHKDPLNLNLAESAFLASIPNNPSLFSPYQFPQNTLKRQRLILSHMFTNGLISQNSYQQALQVNVLKELKPPSQPVLAHPYLWYDDIMPRVVADLVRSGLYTSTKQASDALPTAGYKIYTTIDLADQTHVETVLSTAQLFGNTNQTVPGLKGPDGKPLVDLYEAGVTLIDNQTGGILAIGGGRNYLQDSIDHSDIARQPGSAIKPLFEYGPGIDTGKITAATGIMDGPIAFSTPQGTWSPQDDVPWWHGIVSARYALAQSLNVPAIQVADTVGLQTGASYLAKMGITPQSTTVGGQRTLTNSDLNQLATAIGGMKYGLTVQQLTSAYTTFPNQGVWRQSYLIDKITDRSGVTLYASHPKVQPVFSPQTAYVMDSMLRDVVTHGTATLIGSYYPNYYIYGKTGTTDAQRDGWFIGYTQNYTMGIWMGYNHNEQIASIPYNYKFQIWNLLMKPLLTTHPPTQPLPEPVGIVHMAVDTKSGLLPTALSKAAGAVGSEIFVRGTEPTQPSLVHVQVLYTVVNGKPYLATTLTPPGEIRSGIFLNPKQVPINLSGPPPGTVTLDSSQYVPTLPDPRGGTVLQGPTTSPLATLPAPGNLQASLATDGIQLRWDPVSGATQYTVWRATVPNGPYLNVGRLTTQTQFVDSNIPTGVQNLYYQVYALSASGVSPPSQVLQVPLTSPGSGDNPLGKGTSNTLSSNATNSVVGNEARGGPAFVSAGPPQ
ncbi:glycosyl transferase [Alicyclobacillaceae bacterium I2511]|nr:glycosyl transferase [Alicyclobacillaceae bacterium I2511]